MPYTIHLKHDTRHRNWKALSVTTLKPERLIQDIDPYKSMFAQDLQCSPDQISARVVEISSAQIGSRSAEFVRVVHEAPSSAAVNRKSASAPF